MNSPEKTVLKTNDPVRTKRPYSPPLLSEYGDIRQITQGTVINGHNDGHGTKSH
jgi:hypothetical protein